MKLFHTHLKLRQEFEISRKEKLLDCFANMGGVKILSLDLSWELTVDGSRTTLVKQDSGGKVSL